MAAHSPECSGHGELHRVVGSIPVEQQHADPLDSQVQQGLVTIARVD